MVPSKGKGRLRSLSGEGHPEKILFSYIEMDSLILVFAVVILVAILVFLLLIYIQLAKGSSNSMPIINGGQLLPLQGVVINEPALDLGQPATGNQPITQGWKKKGWKKGRGKEHGHSSFSESGDWNEWR